MSGKPQRKLKKDLPDIWGIKKTKMIQSFTERFENMEKKILE